MNTPNPPHWTLNWYFGVFRTIWVYSVPFWCLTKLGAKRDELVQNSSCHEVASEFFSSNTTDPPHWTQTWHFGAFHTIRVHSGPFGCLTKLVSKRDELVQKFVPRTYVGIFRNERTRSTSLDPKLMFWCVSYHWVHSWPFGCLTKLGGKRAEIVQEFVPRSRIGIFRNERTWSTPFWL